MGDGTRTTISTGPSFSRQLDLTFQAPSRVGVYFARFAAPPASEPQKQPEPVTEPETLPPHLPEVTVTARWRRPLRTGWLYIWLPEKKIWYEYEVSVAEDGEGDVRGHLRNIEWQALGLDVRPASGPQRTIVALPRTQVQVAFSEIQWSWERIAELEADAGRRAARMATLDLTQIVPADQPFQDERDVHDLAHLEAHALGLTAESVEGIRAAAEATELPAVVATLPDWLGAARQRAANYQAMWKLMEATIARLTAGTWFPAASLTVSVLAAAMGDGDLAKQIESIDRYKVRNVLESTWRRTLRAEIRDHKNRLVDLLDGTLGEAELLSFCETIADYVALPVEPSAEGSPCFADTWTVIENLVARLGDQEVALDLHLEPDAASVARSAATDRGRNVLQRITDPAGGHPLHGLVFPPPAEEGSAVPQSHPAAKMDRSAQSQQVQRRIWESLFKFVSHFSSLDNLAQRGAVVDLLVKADVNLRTTEITLGELVGDKPLGDGTVHGPALDPGDYLIRTTIEDDIAENGSAISKRRLARHQGALVEIPPDTDGAFWQGHARAYSVASDGTKELVGVTSIEDFKAAEGLGAARWRKARSRVMKPGSWRVARVKVVVLAKPRSGARRWIYDRTTAQLGLGAAFAVMEAWNLMEATRAFAATGGRDARAVLDFTSALLDSTAAVTEVMTAAYARLPATAGNLGFARFVGLAGRQGFKIGTGVLGAAGGALSAFLSLMDMAKNGLEHDDDAAFGHAVMATGFALGAWSAAASAASLAGPPGWICAVVILVGGALVWWFDDTPLEEWSKLGPFRNNSGELRADPMREHADGPRPSWADPAAVAEALFDAVYRPTLQVVLAPVSAKPRRAPEGNRLWLELRLPYFVDGTSLLHLELRWLESPFFGEEVLLSTALSMQSVEAHEDKYVLTLDVPEELRRRSRELSGQLRFRLEARVRIDVRGDGRLWAPRRSTAKLRGAPVSDDDWLISSDVDFLRDR